MRRLAIPLLLLALLAAAVFVALRRTDEGAAPGVDRARDVSSETPRASRVRAPEPAPLPPRAIRVTVTSMDGRPIVGARVELIRGAARDLRLGEQIMPSVAAPRPEQSVVADEAGAATLGDVAAGRWFVVASAPGFARHVLLGVTRGEDDAPIEEAVVLEKGSAFGGTILDPDGAPANGVDVVLDPASPWPNDVEMLRTRTGTDGAYRFDNVEPGRYVLWYAAPSGVLVDAGEVLIPSLDGLDVRMTRGAAIEGVVRDAESGVAVAGARVFGIHEVRSYYSMGQRSTIVFDVSTADHLGRFALRTWRSRYQVTRLLVDAPGYAPMPAAESGDGPPGAVSEGQRFVFDLRVGRAATVKGTLSIAGVQPAGFVVSVRPQDWDENGVPYSDMWSCVTGADGSFVVDRLPAGIADIHVAGPARHFSTSIRDVVLHAGDAMTQDVRVDVERVRVERSVVDPDGKPIAGVEVVQRFGTVRTVARTGDDGTFALDAIFAGARTHVELRRGRYVATRTLGRTTDGPLEPLPTPADVGGTLVRQDGSPVTHARVRLVTGLQLDHGEFAVRWEGLRETVSAADGTYRMPLTSGPDHYLTVPLLGKVDSEVADDGSRRVKMRGVVRVAGSAVAEDGGAPVAGVLIVDKYDVVVARAGADGKFAFEWAPAFDDPLHASCAGRLPRHIDQTSAPVIVPMRTAFAVTGVVRMTDGTPASGLSVAIRTDEGEGGEARCATGADGRFVWSGLAEGDAFDVEVTDTCRHAVAGPRTKTTVGRGELRLVVMPAAELVVEVVDESGEPVGRCNVLASAETAAVADDYAYADEHGRCRLGLAPGETYSVEVGRYGYVEVQRPGVRGGGDPVRVVLKKKP